MILNTIGHPYNSSNTTPIPSSWALRRADDAALYLQSRFKLECAVRKGRPLFEIGRPVSIDDELAAELRRIAVDLAVAIRNQSESESTLSDDD